MMDFNFGLIFLTKELWVCPQLLCVEEEDACLVDSELHFILR